MPLFSLHRAPAPPHDRHAYERPNTEPIFVSLKAWSPKRHRPGIVNNGGEYLTMWYVGRIAENAVRNTHHSNCYKLLMSRDRFSKKALECRMNKTTRVIYYLLTTRWTAFPAGNRRSFYTHGRSTASRLVNWPDKNQTLKRRQVIFFESCVR